VAAAAALALSLPSAASAATVPGTKIPVPQSARVQGTTSTAATNASTQAGGAQPGTVAPGSATPTGSTPGATTPSSATPTAPGTVAPNGGVSGAGGTVPGAGSAGAAPTTTAPGLPSTLGAGRRTRQNTSRRLSGLALVLAIVGALLALACLAWAIVRWRALEPRWSTALMHSLREATYRASATWAEFSDWARIGH
jgi:hypothetical protein